MQAYTKKLIHTIIQRHFKKSNDELSTIGPTLIPYGNTTAYARKFETLYTTALENIIEDIFEVEKKALLALEELPSPMYFTEFKNTIITIVESNLRRLDEKIDSQLRPYSNITHIQIMRKKIEIFRTLIGQRVEQLKEELSLEKTRHDNVHSSNFHNTVNNYGNIGLLKQGKEISITEHKTSINSEQPGIIKKIALVIGILSGLVTIGAFIYSLLNT